MRGRFAELDVDAATGRRGVGGVLDEVCRDQAKETPAVTRHAAREPAVDAESQVFRRREGGAAVFDDRGELVAAEFEHGADPRVAEQSDDFGDHGVHAVGVARGGGEVGIAGGYRGAQLGHGTLKAVDEVRSDLPERRGFRGQREFEVRAREPLVALGDDALHARDPEVGDPEHEDQQADAREQRDPDLTLEALLDGRKFAAEVARIHVVLGETDRARAAAFKRDDHLHDGRVCAGSGAPEIAIER